MRNSVDYAKGGVKKKHWSPAAADEGSAHGTKLKVMRIKVSVLTLVE